MLNVKLAPKNKDANIWKIIMLKKFMEIFFFQFLLNIDLIFGICVNHFSLILCEYRHEYLGGKDVIIDPKN